MTEKYIKKLRGFFKPFSEETQPDNEALAFFDSLVLHSSADGTRGGDLFFTSENKRFIVDGRWHGSEADYKGAVRVAGKLHQHDYFLRHNAAYVCMDLARGIKQDSIFVNAQDGGQIIMWKRENYYWEPKILHIGSDREMTMTHLEVTIPKNGLQDHFFWLASDGVYSILGDPEYWEKFDGPQSNRPNVAKALSEEILSGDYARMAAEVLIHPITMLLNQSRDGDPFERVRQFLLPIQEKLRAKQDSLTDDVTVLLTRFR
jgi:hypothetical protein